MLWNNPGIATVTARGGGLRKCGDRDSPAAVRDLGERFISKVLPFFKRQTKQVRDLIPELYLHGLASGDFEMALRGLLGEGAPLSATSIQRLKEKWESEYEQWKGAPIEEKELAYAWADGIYVRRGSARRRQRYWW